MTAVAVAVFGTGAVAFMLIFIVALCRDGRNKTSSRGATQVEATQSAVRFFRNVVVFPDPGAARLSRTTSGRFQQGTQTR